MTDPADGVWLQTLRLTLRAPREADAAEVLCIHGDRRTYEHLPEARMRTTQEAEELVAAWHAHWDEHGFGYAVVLLRVDDDDDDGDDGDRAGSAAIGFCGVKHARLGRTEVFNLYYRFAPEAWGCGYALEAAAAVVAWAQDAHPERPVMARVATNNPSSARVAERVGLRLTDRQDDRDPVPHQVWLSRAGV